jgi:nitrilase
MVRSLLRYYEYSQRVQIHVASWPAEFEMPDPEKQPWLYHETGEASYRASQFMAIEGQTFVLVASQIITEENLEKNNLVGNHVTKTVCTCSLFCPSSILCLRLADVVN